MWTDIKCLLGFHKCEIIETKPLEGYTDQPVGIVIISRCINCGKIYDKKIYTDDLYCKYH